MFIRNSHYLVNESPMQDAVSHQLFIALEAGDLVVTEKILLEDRPDVNVRNEVY